VAGYRFVTVSEIAVPVERAWAEVSRPDRWATWWPGLIAVKEIESGDADSIGALEEFTFKSRLPYTLVFRGRITRIDPLRRMDVEAVGELEGVAVYQLEDLGASTRMTLTWTVRTTKPWMNILAPVARPFFAWNHDVLMKAGARGLARKLGSEVTRFDAGRPLRALWMVVPMALVVRGVWKRVVRD
jgi:hypothetical protein